jgi:hypothetical protein
MSGIPTLPNLSRLRQAIEVALTVNGHAPRSWTHLSTGTILILIFPWIENIRQTFSSEPKVTRVRS